MPIIRQTSRYQSAKECVIEDKVGRELQKLFPDLLYLKLNVVGNRGYPDRQLFWLGGSMFIEFKRKGEKLRKLQEHIIAELRSRGQRVDVHDDFEQCMEQVAGYIRATLRADTGNGSDLQGTGSEAIFTSRQRKDSHSAQGVLDPATGWYGGSPSSACSASGDHD